MKIERIEYQTARMKVVEELIIVNQARRRMDALGGVYYNNAPLEQFRVTSDSGHVYTVTRFANDETTGDAVIDTWGCTCPAGSHHRICKHVNATINHLALI